MKPKTSDGKLAALARARIERRTEPTREDLEDDERLRALGYEVYRLNGVRVVIDLSGRNQPRGQ